jgi:hypothetical protein
MRTTVELPPELMRAAKARAAEEGESLKAWFTVAVARALGRSPAAGAPAPRPWPVFGQPRGKKVRVTNAMLAEAEVGNDVEKYRRGLRRPR